MKIVAQDTGKIHTLVGMHPRPNPKGVIRDPRVAITRCGKRIAVIGDPKDNPTTRKDCC